MHGVLAGETIDDQQGFTGVGDIAHRFDLAHQLFVDRQAARGVEHIDVVAAHRCLRLCAFGNLHGVFAFDDGQGIDADLHAEDRQLFHRRRAVHIERGHQHALAVAVFQTFGELGRGRGFTGALQTDHQDRGGGAVDFQRAGFAFAFQRVDQRVVDDLDDLLAGGDRFGDGLTGGLVLHRFDEITRDGQGHVRLEQGDADFAQGGFHILFREGTLFGETVKDAGEAFGKILKHGPWPPSIGCGAPQIGCPR